MLLRNIITKVHMLLHDIIRKGHILLAQRQTFKKGLKIHNFCATTKFFLHIFGVAQNFQLNGEGFKAQKGGATSPLATALCIISDTYIEL